MRVGGVVILMCCLVGGAASEATPPADDQLPVWSTTTAPAVVCYPGERRAFVVTIPAEQCPVATVIDDVTSSCSCVETVPPAEPFTHPAGSPLPVHVRVDAGDVRAQAPFDVWVVGTRNAQAGALRIALQTEISDYFTWPNEDAVWRTAAVEAGTTPEQTWNMGRGRHPAAWDRLTVNVQGDPSLVTASVTPGSDGTWVTRTRWTPGTHVGVITALLEWRAWAGATELPYHPQRSVRLDVRGRVFAVPAMALLGGMRPGASRTVSIDLAARTGELPAVTRVELPDEEDLHATLAVAAGGRQELSLTCVAGRTAKRYDKAVQVYFADGTILRIPYLGRVYP